MTMRCGNCGAEADARLRFCAHCGAGLGAPLPAAPALDPRFGRLETEFFFLLGQRETGRLGAEAFRRAVEGLRVQDDLGRWWCIDPASQTWLIYQDAAWWPATPPDPPEADAPRPPAPNGGTTELAAA